MAKTIQTKLTLVAVFCLAAMMHDAPADPVTNLYEIVAGEYTECCGIAGEFRWDLPNESQSHIHLITDAAQQSAQMIVLGYFDAEPVFQVFDDGRLHSDYIEFGLPGPGPAPDLPWQHYIVSNSAGGIRFNGITVRPVIGADVPNRFAHSNVVANFLPPTPVRASIRVSAVEVCWESISNRSYQVQYKSSVGDSQWTNLQSTVFGNGSLRCVADHVDAEQPRRFYRVIPVP